MISIEETGMKSSYKIILNPQGIIIKEKGFFSSSFKEVFSKEYSKITSIAYTNKVVTHTLTFDFNLSINFSDEDDANKIKLLVELGSKNISALQSIIGSGDEDISLNSISLPDLEDLADKNKFGKSATTDDIKSVFVEEDDDDDCQYRYDGVTMTFKKGQEYVDEEQKDDFPTDVQCIVFPSSFESLSEDDFPNDMPKLRKLDFTNARRLECIDDDCFHDCSSLRVVVLPPKLGSMTRFKDCDRLIEIHAPASLDTLGPVTGDEDSRITAYLSSPEICFDEDFCKDCKQIFVPKSVLKEWREEAKEYDLDVKIDPLPAGYSFPKEALEEPWTPNDMYSSETTQQKTRPSVTSVAARVSTPGAPSVAACPPPMPKFEVHAIIEGQQRGPYDHTQFKRLVDAGMVSAQTMVWTQGMSGWEKAGSVDMLAEFFPQNGPMMPPPPPMC